MKDQEREVGVGRDRILVSVLNLVATVNGHVLCILNKKQYEKEKRLVAGCIGGAAKLTKEGAAWLAAHGIEPKDEMRFGLPEGEKLNAMWNVLCSKQGHSLFETSLERELMEELNGIEIYELQKGKPILYWREMKKLKISFRGQIPLCHLPSDDMGGYRVLSLLRFFAIDCPWDTYEKIRNSRIIEEPDTFRLRKGRYGQRGMEFIPNVSAALIYEKK